MAELAAFGLASSIAQFVGLGFTVVKRVRDFQSRAKDTPKVLRDIDVQLAHMIEVCGRIKVEDLAGDAETAFARLLDGCVRHLEALDGMLAKVVPTGEDSAVGRTRKAIISVRLEKKSSESLHSLEGYKTAMSLHFAHSSFTSPGPPHAVTVARDTCYFFPSSQVCEFIERKRLLGRIRSALPSDGRSSNRPCVVVLIGMGGQGKTQLALEYCRSAQLDAKYSSILWIEASSRTTLLRSYSNIADFITKRRSAFKDANSCVSFVKDTLETWAKPWLVVFDNFDNPSALQNIMSYIPRSRDGAVIVTSRHAGTKRLATTSIDVSGMEESEAVNMLLTRMERPMTVQNIQEASHIAMMLGYLPLAMDQAAAYIGTRNIALPTFFEHYQERKEIVMKFVPELWDYRHIHENEDDESGRNLTVFTTWELSFREIGRGLNHRASVVHLLTLCAFFNNLNIREDLFRSSFDLSDSSRDWLHALSSEGKWDRYKFEDVVVELSRLSLLQHFESRSEGCCLSLHPMIQDWMQLRQNIEHRRTYTLEAIEFVARSIEANAVPNEEDSLQITREMLSHIDACLQNAAKYFSNEGALKIEVIRRAFDVFGDFFNRQGRFREAERLLQTVLAADEKQHGINSLHSLGTKVLMSQVYLNQGNYSMAKDILLTVLPEVQQQLSSEDIRTLEVITCLAKAYHKEGDYATAVDYYKRGIRCHELCSPCQHVAVLKTYENLARLYRDVGEHDAALDLYTKTLSGYERFRGPNSTEALNTLANAYRSQSFYEKSAELDRRALERNSMRLGADHPVTLDNMVNLGINLRNLGDYPEAAMIMSEALERSQRVLGSEHPDTLRALANFGHVCEKMGCYIETEAIWEKVLDGRIKRLGADNSYTIRTAESLAGIYWLLDKKEHAEELAKRTLRSRRKSHIGTDLPQFTLLLAETEKPTSHDRQPYSASEALFSRALQRELAVRRTHHVDFLASWRNLANVYIEQGRLDEAESLYTGALNLSKKLFGITHRDSRVLLEGLSEINRRQGKSDVAGSIESDNAGLPDVLAPGSAETVKKLVTVFLKFMVSAAEENLSLRT